MSGEEEDLERLRQEVSHLRSNYESMVQHTRGKIKTHSTPEGRTTPNFYSPRSPDIRDPLVEHLTQKLAETEAETENLRRQLADQKTQKKGLSDIRAPSYSGSTDFDEYLSQFIGICEYHGWSDEEAATVMLAKLQGDALSVAAASDDHSLRSLIVNLRRNFSHEQEEVATLKLHGRAQRNHESYESLSFDIQRLTKKAYSGTDEKTRDRLAKDAFINAISDEIVREKLRDKNPRTLAEAVEEAKRISANRELEKTRTKTTVRRTKTKAEKNEIEELRAQIRQLQERGREEKEEKTDEKTVQGHWKVRSPREPPTCWKCGKKGHLARWCPFSDEQLKEMRRAGQIPAEKETKQEN